LTISKINIAITGPESTGKTTLARILAERMNGLYIPEFARTYLEKSKGIYFENDLLTIAKGQSEAISAGLSSDANLILCDTDMTVIEIWYQVKFGPIPENLQTILDQHTHDFYLLCYPDIPWEADVLRENPFDRMALFHLYEKQLQAKSANYQIVKGIAEQRVLHAEKSIKDFIQKQKPAI
jgi:NadR type nicotinamide-nucleotide adenylyltransferase